MSPPKSSAKVISDICDGVLEKLSDDFVLYAKSHNFSEGNGRELIC